MKIIIFLALLPFSAFSQNKLLINKMNSSVTLESIREVSDQIVNSGPDKYIFYKIADSSLREEKRKVALYTLAKDTDSDQSTLSDSEKDSLVKIVWEINNQGFNFHDVTGSEKMLVPFWNQNISNVSNEYRVNPGLRYKLVRNEKTYSIEKWY